MKSQHFCKRMLVLFAAVISLTLSGTAAFAQEVPFSLPEKGIKAENLRAGQNAHAQQFDGHELYQRAFEVLRDYHIALADEATRKQWVAEWEHKHDGDTALNTEAGTDKAIAEMVKSLNQRFDYFLDKKQVEQEDEQVNSSLVGVGMSVKLRDQESLIKQLPKNPTREQVRNALRVSKDHPLMVEEPMEGAPAEKAGLKAGDAITRVDGKSLNGLTLDEAVARIRGKEGSQVKITYERTDTSGKASTTTLTITRARVVSHVVKFKDLGNGVSYVKLRNFESRNATAEMAAALMQAAQGKALIIDLRNNPGGSLSSVLTMAAMLVPEGTILVTHDREGGSIREHRLIMQQHYLVREAPDDKDPDKVQVKASDRPELIIPPEMPVVVLVNENSYSASEILSGVLQVRHRATIVGTATGGKGVGQSVINLPYGRRLHVTSFEFLPGGMKMDWIGIVPDVQVEQPKDVQDDKQLQAAQDTVSQLIQKADELARKRQELRQKHEDDFNRSRDRLR